ncbi:response regulator transcription factor [Cryptosporangium aurantiacum]|uniref:DNA-binding response regulator, NarL/FixJ family, contains REC and HTH domains n=1 Tax=Cryptosporangium aurantiacum TaxID=134849 RepID=A0A1M7RKQ6_9ACTN|nr:response regulator transcription factor [Cryptosporangium aurantiacum]SHN46925.1 DNA-binding response regulator, NarL/FixJ family, contains REC and HTH domains [Cryptosporangium aurantiacum]
MAEEPIRIVVADDHPVFRDGLAVLLTSVPGLDVVGVAATGVEAVELALELQPDVVIMDVQMPTLNGIDATRRIADFFAAGPAPTEAFPGLTAREREILELVAAGRSNPQIAAALYLSPKTVRNNVSNIFAKLHVTDRAEAIVRAREAGLGRS